ncbi:MAG: hypothetical protein U0559_20840, partial [Anaerolineae bacterium]
RTTWLSTEEINGHIYMLYPVGASILAAPVVWVIDKVSPGFAASLRTGFGEPVQTAIASFVVALTVVFVFLIARLYVTRFPAALIALTLAFGTSAWSVVSRTLWQHGPSMLMLTIALYLTLLARKRPAASQFISLPMAFAYVVRPTNSIAVVVFSLYVLIVYRRYFVRYLAWALVIAVPFVLLNLSVYHTLLPNYYRWYSGFSLATFFQALVGHLISPSRGLLIYSPILLLSIAGIFVKARQREFEKHDVVVLAIMGLHWISISLWWNWWGGVSYGPRLFSDMLPYFAYWLIPVAAMLAKVTMAQRRLLITTSAVLVAFSIFVHARGVTSSDVMDWNASPAPIDFYSFRVWDWRDPQWLRGLHWGTPVDVAVSGLAYDHVIDPTLWAQVGTNDIRPRQFDVTSSLITPPGEAWFALADNQTAANEFAPILDGVAPIATGRTMVDNSTYRLFRFDLTQRLQHAAKQSDSTVSWSPQVYPDSPTVNVVNLPVGFGEVAQLLGHKLTLQSPQLTLITFWQAGLQVEPPLQMFVHVIAKDGSIVAQEDRLDAAAANWRSGDYIAQINHLTLPDQPGSFWIEIGLYNRESGERVPVLIDGREVARRLLLKQVMVR